jgi:hypothetical protein
MTLFRNAVKTELLKARSAEFYLRDVETVMDAFMEKLTEAADQTGRIGDIIHLTRQYNHQFKLRVRG